MDNEIKEYLKEHILNYNIVLDSYAFMYYLNNKIVINENKNIINFILPAGDEKFTYEYLGYLDNHNKWYWAWILPMNNSKSTICNDLLLYAVDLDYDSTITSYLKKIILSNSFTIDNKIILHVLFAIIKSLLKDKILVIFDNFDSNTNRIDCYLLINKIY
jgi:hypothetical protein